MKYVLIVTALLVGGLSALATAAQPSAQAVFEQIKKLEGNWHSTKGTTTVNYALMANGSTIVETWTMSPTRQSMTVYTMDGERMLATHYCPQGNAPRLLLGKTDEDGSHHFEFLDGANLHKRDASHEHAFWIRLDSPDHLARSETYIVNGSAYDPAKDPGEAEAFERDK